MRLHARLLSALDSAPPLTSLIFMVFTPYMVSPIAVCGLKSRPAAATTDPPTPPGRHLHQSIRLPVTGSKRCAFSESIWKESR